MTRSTFELVGQPPGSMPARHERPRSRTPVVVVVMLIALAAGVSVVMQHQLDQFLNDLDRQSLNEATQVFARSIDQQRRYAQSAVAVLAEDTRVRAPVMAPNFDENTVRDVLEDLMKSSGASMLAVLDASGRVRAVAGAQGLRELDLGSSSVVKTAQQRPSTVVWAFPERVLVVGVAPVHSADQVAALLVMGFEIGEAIFGSIQNAVGVAGALLIGDRVAAASTNDPAIMQAFRAARELEDDKEQVVRTNDQQFVARVSRTSTSAAAGKVVWLVKHHHESGRAFTLQIMNWMPAILVTLTFALIFLLARRGAHGR
jgi:hypothetical protein